MPLFYTEMLQVRNKCCIVWHQPEYDNNLPKYKRTYLIRNFKNSKTYTGMITASTAKRIRTAVDILLQVSPSKKITNPFTKATITHRLSFITLTVHDTKENYTPKEGHKRLLKPFLRILREKQLLNTYIWKAEFQQRGQLHYHITTPEVIDWRILRKYWNGLLQKNKMLDEYYNVHNHYDPNSIDIHSVYKLNDIQAYLTKYLSKAEQNQTPTTGKIWDTSENLKGKKHISFTLNNANARKIVKHCDNGNMRIKDLAQCSIIESKTIKPKQLLDKEQLNQYNDYLLSIREKK